MPKFEIPTLEIPTEATRPLYAGVGATDLVVGYVRDAVADLQKRVTGVQKDVQTRITSIDRDPKALRDQALVVVTTQIDALSKEAKARREAIEKRVAELQSDAAGIPATVTSAYADLASRGEVLVGRIRKQESTKATKSAAKTTTAKAKTTKTQATKATKSTASTAKKTAKTTAKKTTATAKKTAATPAASAKATATAAKKTTASATTAATEAAEKVGD
jgi:heparin binding hemagglutinin HbhA